MTGQLTAQISTSDSSNSQSCGFGLPAWAVAAVGDSELFTGGPQVKLMGPRAAGLPVQLVVGLRDGCRLKQILRGRVFLRDHAVEEDVRHMDVFRAQLPSHRLRQRAQGKFR